MAIDADISEWEKLAMDLNQEGKKLVIISPFPRINQDPKLCIYWFTKFNKKCPQANIFQSSVNKKIELSIRKYESLRKYGVTYINIFYPVEDIVENAPDNKLSYYHTKIHLSRKATLLLKNYLRKYFLINNYFIKFLKFSPIFFL